ncbi:MAG: ABC transporter permease [Rhodocyclaceae bacterium]|nr:ABC transporter permease [Rhodocyclaceae bacterium]
MPFLPVLLWTDALLFALLAAAVAAGFYVRRREYLMLAWRRVAGDGLGMAAATVLALFLVVGLLDSLHYRSRLEGAGTVWSVEVESALDALAEPLRRQVEKTYSAPLADRLFSKETLERPDGSQVRDYPRLKWGAAHLSDPEAGLAGDVARRMVKGEAVGLVLWLLIVAAVTRTVARRESISPGEAWRRIRRRETPWAWRSVLLTLGVMLFLAAPLAALSGHYHVFGTDKVGQDVFFLTLKSIRTALVIGTLTTLIMLPFAAALGILAGYLGGWVDDVIQYVYTTLNSIPGVLLIAAAVLMMQVVIDNHPQWFATAAERADARLLALCFILGITSWTGLCRLLRGEALKLRELEFIQAARAFGVSPGGIMLRHILPNVMHIVLISLVMDFSGLVLAEAVLSYVGIGVDPNTVSFGTMINAARMELAREPAVWWSLAAAFSFMLALVLSANLFADSVRDAFDPRLRART